MITERGVKWSTNINRKGVKIMGLFDRLPGIDRENRTRRNVLVGVGYAFGGMVVLSAITGGSGDDDEESGNAEFEQETEESDAEQVDTQAEEDEDGDSADEEEMELEYEIVNIDDTSYAGVDRYRVDTISPTPCEFTTENVPQIVDDVLAEVQSAHWITVFLYETDDDIEGAARRGFEYLPDGERDQAGEVPPASSSDDPEYEYVMHADNCDWMDSVFRESPPS